MRRIKIILCCRGSLGLIGLKALLRMPVVDVVAVMVDSESKEAEELAKKHSIKIFKGNPINMEGLSFPLCDLLISLNYIFILPEGILSKARLAALNIHGSLLPKYMGRTPMTWAIINDESETGITVHEMVDEVDCGPIVYQERIKITNADTGGTLLLKISARIPIVLSKIIQQILKGALSRKPQDLSKRTYFGKREACDGIINWRWSARKVYNWVRAQTKPYPGAFGYVSGKKYRFWWVEEVTFGIVKKRPGQSFRRNGFMCIVCGQGAVRAVKYELGEGT